MTEHALRRLAGGLSALAISATIAAIPTVAAAATPTNQSCVTESPSATDPAIYQPLQLCAQFDKAAYRSSELIHLTITAKNLGTATAKNIWMGPPFGGGFQTTGPVQGLFLPPAQSGGRDLPPNASFTFEQDGYYNQPTSGTAMFTDSVIQNGSNGRSFGPPVTISADVTAVTGTATIHVFDDLNRNGSQDPGEDGKAGLLVKLDGPFDGLATGARSFSIATNADGDAVLAGIPGGQYFVEISGQGNVNVSGPPKVTVDGPTSATYALQPPLTDILSGTMAFDQAGYHVGDAAHLTITLTNKSPATLEHVQAECDHVGNPDELRGEGAGWEQLTDPGIAVPPGTTTLHLSEIVVDEAVTTGQFLAECTFNPPGDGTGPDLNATVTALPSTRPTVDATLKLIDDDPAGGPTTNVFSELVDESSLDPISDDFMAGTLKGVPIGCYGIEIGDGWHLAPGQTNILDTGTQATVEWDVHVLPGTAPQPPIQAQPCASTPPSTSTSGGVNAEGTGTPASGQTLANTGVNVLGYTIPATALIAAGALVLLFTRRKAAN